MNKRKKYINETINFSIIKEMDYPSEVYLYAISNPNNTNCKYPYGTEEGKIKIENKNFKLKLPNLSKNNGFITRDDYIPSSNRVRVKIINENFPNNTSFDISINVITLLNLIKTFGLDENNIIKQSFSLIEFTDDYIFSREYIPVPMSIKNKYDFFKRAVKYNKKHITKKFKPGYRYLNLDNLSEYLYIGEVKIFCQIWREFTNVTNTNIFPYSNHGPKTVHLFLKDDDLVLDNMKKRRVPENKLFSEFILYNYSSAELFNFDNYYIKNIPLTVMAVKKTSRFSFVEEDELFDGDKLNINLLKNNALWGLVREFNKNSDIILKMIESGYNLNTGTLRDTINLIISITDKNEVEPFIQKDINDSLSPLINYYESSGNYNFYYDKNIKII